MHHVQTIKDMKRRILFVVALLMMVVALSAKTYQVTADKLNVRNAPEKGAVIGSLTSGAEVEVINISNGWAEITFKGKKAYISAKYITPAKKSAAAAKSTTKDKNTAKNTTKAAKDAKKGAAPAVATDTKGISDPIIAGFHITLDALWTGRNGWFRHVAEDGTKDKWAMISMGTKGKGTTVFGLSLGMGFEYNGIVHRAPKTNIMVGFRSGVYYDWYGSLKQDISVAHDGSLKMRRSMHSFTFPVQPTLSFEWKTAKGTPLGLGIFTGPIFETYFAMDWVMRGDGGFGFTNFVTGHMIVLTGDQMDSGTLPKEQRSGVFNCLWGTGLWFQVGKFRILASTDWGISNYSWVNGGDVDGVYLDHIDAHVNRFITFGFAYVFH